MNRICRIRKGSFTIKDMKGMKENLGAPVVGPALWISGRVGRIAIKLRNFEQNIQ